MTISGELLVGDVVVGVDANAGGDLHGLFGDPAGGEFGVAEQRGGGGKRKRAAGADGRRTLVRFDDIAIAADNVRVPVGRYQQQRFQVTEHTVGAPVLGQLHGGAG